MSKTRKTFKMWFRLSPDMCSFSLSDLHRTGCLHRRLRARMFLQGWVLSGGQRQMCSSWKVLFWWSKWEVHDLWICLCGNVWLYAYRMYRTMCLRLFLPIGSFRSPRQFNEQPLHPTFEVSKINSSSIFFLRSLFKVKGSEELTQSNKFDFHVYIGDLFLRVKIEVWPHVLVLEDVNETQSGCNGCERKMEKNPSTLAESERRKRTDVCNNGNFWVECLKQMPLISSIFVA